jgi:hypothetical protein
VNAFAAADQAPVGAAGVGRVAQAGEPFDRHREFAAIIESDAQNRGGDGDVNGERFSLQRQSGHAAS